MNPRCGNAVLDLVAVGPTGAGGLAADAVEAAARAGAGAAFMPAGALNPLLVRAARVVLLESSLWQTDDGMAAVQKAGAVARAAGRRIVLALSDAATVHRHRHGVVAFLRSHADLLLCGPLAACALYDSHRVDSIVPLIRRDCRAAVLNRGARGAIVVRPDCIQLLDGQPSGAGEGAYAGVLLAALGRGEEVVECCRLAAGLGACGVATVWSAPGIAPRLAPALGAAVPG